MTAAGRTVGLVLAAGTASRFGSPKAIALLEGRPLLQHVLDAAAGLGLAGVAVVLGHAAEAIARVIDPRGADVVLNRDPTAGIASSLRVGLGWAREHHPDADAVLVLLGDQPFVRVEVVRAILDVDPPPGRWIVIPRYAEGGGPNPALLLRPAWPLAAGLEGDRGMGPMIASRPELVVEVAVAGGNPDVDTPVDLALAAWAARVRADREQVDRIREVPDGADFYGPVSGLFRADPDRTDDPQLDRLLELARPGDVWLDIGAGAGRFALPLARRVREVVAIDPSAGMLEGLRSGMAEHAIRNIRVLQGRWPLDPTELPPDGPPTGDVALVAHLGYDIEAIGPFVEAMEAAARRRCVAVLMERQPSSSVDPFWPPIHGEERVALPGLRQFIELLRLRGRSPEVHEEVRPRRAFESLEQLEGLARRHLWIAEGGEKGRRLRELAPAIAHERDGRWYLETTTPLVGIVSWAPR